MKLRKAILLALMLFLAFAELYASTTIITKDDTSSLSSGSTVGTDSFKFSFTAPPKSQGITAFSVLQYDSSISQCTAGTQITSFDFTKTDLTDGSIYIASIGLYSVKKKSNSSGGGYNPGGDNGQSSQSTTLSRTFTISCTPLYYGGDTTSSNKIDYTLSFNQSDTTLTTPTTSTIKYKYQGTYTSTTLSENSVYMIDTIIGNLKITPTFPATKIKSGDYVGTVTIEMSSN